MHGWMSGRTKTGPAFSQIALRGFAAAALLLAAPACTSSAFRDSVGQFGTLTKAGIAAQNQRLTAITADEQERIRAELANGRADLQLIAAAGLVTIGFLAVARLTGGALASDRGTTSPRGVHLRALVIGLVAYLGIWMVAALFAWNPVIGAVCRAVAIAITWVAATLGLGAALSSRAGTRRI